jgi:DnaK suppressor protein
MIVSILQMMGFPKGKPEKARSQETNAEKLKKAAEQNKTEAPPKKKAEKAKPEQTAIQPAPAKEAKAKKKETLAAPKVEEKKQAVKAAGKDKDKDKDTKKVSATAPVPKEPKPKKLMQAVADIAPKKVAQSVKAVQAKATQATANAANVAKNAVAEVKAVQQSVKTAAKAVVAEAKPVVKAVAEPVVAAATKAVKTTSRLASITVPSIAQTIASTAAKSTYSQTPLSPAMEPVIPAIVKKDTKLAQNWKTKPVAQLSDAELLAMPDSEYMNDVQLAAFRLKLSALKSGILNNAGETTEHLREDSSVVPDPADRATIEEEHALELRTRDRERKLLKKIEQSIARIDAGDYGYCDETGEPIGVGRLLARPTATLSLEAQQRRELKQKMFGD